ncbi:MAG: heavy metal translocating P-type ATPase, partial [Parachlamydiaceae bacterium]
MSDASLFEEYFEGKEEAFSPFITPETRFLGKNLYLKASLFALFVLLLSFLLSFNPSYAPLSTGLLIAVYFFAGIPALIETIEDLSNLIINIDVLMTLAAFGSVLIGSPMEGALLLVLFAISGSMEDAVTSKAKSSLKELHKLSPTSAWVKSTEGRFQLRSVKDVKVGEIILIKAGEVVPLDGKVFKGVSSVNLVHLTGENLPVLKKEGDTVPSGAKNMEGALEIEVSHLSRDSTIAKIIELVTQAQDAKPRLQQWFDHLSERYAKTIIVLAFIFAISFPYLFGMPFLGEEGSIYRALAFLIAASPCALIIAIPIAYLSALSGSERNGVLLNGGVTLDALYKVNKIGFDKTGTLTTGLLKWVETVSLSGKKIDEDILPLAYTMEVNAVHPIAKAIQAKGEEEKVKPKEIRDFKMIPGYGVEANFEGRPVYIGQPDYLEDRLDKFKFNELMLKVNEARKEGYLIAVMRRGEDLYLFKFEDTPRFNVKPTLARLHDMGYNLAMLTGDHYDSAQKVAKELGLDEFYADLKPKDKLDMVEKLSQNNALAFVGDGVNDAPALARATVGIGMGKGGSRAAVDAADVVLLQDSIEKLDWLFKKSRQTRRVVRQNLFVATLAIFVAAI